MVFSLYSSLFWELIDIFDPKASQPRQNIDISNVAKQSHVCAHHFFCSQVFKTSDVLNSDGNIVNIALIAFCSLAVTKLAHWPMPSLLSHVVWVSGRYFATVVVCFSFASIEFSLKRFLSFFDCFMPAALSRFS